MFLCFVPLQEMTGRPILDPASVPETIEPMLLEPVGNYALGVTWTDGHKSLFPYVSFVPRMAKKKAARAETSNV